MSKKKLAYIAILLIASTGCGTVPAGNIPSNGVTDAPGHIRAIETRTYTGNRGAIIFSINKLEEKSLKNVIDRLIRVFAEQEIPVDVAISVPRNTQDQDNLAFLIPYSDAGLIDINLDGADISWLDVDTPNVENAFASLKAQLLKDTLFIKQYFGSSPVTCFFPYEEYNEHNYRILQETGFNIISCREEGNFSASRQPVNWAGKTDAKGLYRLPIITNVSYPGINPLVEATTATTNDENRVILNNIDKYIKGFGLAVISIEPRSFVSNDGKIDTAKILQLSNLVKECRNRGEMVTFNGWLKYASNYISVRQSKPRVLPPYNGGPTVIFRLDDVSKGWYEDADKALIELFKSNGVPLDCGVISNVSGANSYELPWLKQYHDEGTVGISVHGYDWTYYQLDTVKSGLTFEQIKFKLIKARDSYLNYYGVSPLAITVPTDFFDKTGYQAIEEAGFKVFSTQILIEPHPSTVPVDYDGRKDPNGMYRLPTASDVCLWENEKFTDPYDVSKLSKVNDYCKFYQALSTSTMSDDFFGNQVCHELSMLNVAVISLHPSAFADQTGKIDKGRLEKVDAIVKWVKTFATVTTFEQWYNYNALKK